MCRDRKAMNRMRMLYAKLCYPTFRSVPDDRMAEWINAVAEAALRRGLWCITPQTPRQKREGIIPRGAMSTARYALLRRWFKIEGVDERNWHVWYAKAGFTCYTFEFVGRRHIGVVA